MAPTIPDKLIRMPKALPDLQWKALWEHGGFPEPLAQRFGDIGEPRSDQDTDMKSHQQASQCFTVSGAMCSSSASDFITI